MRKQPADHFSGTACGMTLQGGSTCGCCGVKPDLPDMLFCVQGIAFMHEAGLLGQSPEDIAKFLAKTQGLNKTMIGEYLGEREEVCLKVMHAYVDAMDFTNSDFDAAIR